MRIDTHLERLAALAGIRIEYALLPPDRDGEYRHKHRTIRLRRGMSARLHRSVLAHELAHAVYADEPTRFGPLHAKQERRANEWAALRLIHHDDYRRAEELHEGHAGGMATELGVVVSVIEAYRDILLRVEDAVYVRPRMGAGMWDHREDVA